MYRSTSVIASSKNLSKFMYNGIFNILDIQGVALNNVLSRNVSQKLAKLPVPELKDTLQKYFKSVIPFLTEEELVKTKKLICSFECQNGKKLQEFLISKAAKSENWLTDWWINAAYLDFRSPVVVWSSPGQVLPFEEFQCEEARIEYTAKIIMAALDYKIQIDENKIPVDMMGKFPLDMAQYTKVFGTCRIPGVTRDGLEFNPSSKHIVVACNNHFYKVEVFNAQKQVASKKQLVCILNDILKSSSSKTEPIGIFTSENRDNWGKAYELLIKDPTNSKSAKEIQTSLFLVCLDDCMPSYKDANRQTVASHQFIHGGGSKHNGGNRWHDKTVQFVIGKDGNIGLTYEHSPAEGQPIAVMVDYLVNYIKSGKYSSIPDVCDLKPAQKLPFCIDECLEKYLNNAKQNLDKLINDLDVYAFTFKCYGKEFIKSQKLSPDSFIQMALQYTFYRLHKVPGAHYESAATRKYIHGRTETIRSCSIESVAFAKAMLSDCVSDADKLKALQDAINGHKKYSLEAVNGYGVDRHLLGLKLAALELKIDLPDLYKDKSYLISTHMKISSSQVATKCDGFMCFGPLVMDGYACCYNPRPNDMNFAISAMKSSPDTGATKFKEALEDSLMDMQNVCLKTQKHKL